MVIEFSEHLAIQDVLVEFGLADRPDWLPSRIEGPVAVAREGERVIGAARLYRSWLHPARWRLAIHVDPAWRRRGIGTKLLDALVERLPEDSRELQAATTATNVSGIAFLCARAFESLMTTRLGMLQPAAVPGSWLDRVLQSRDELLRTGVQVVRLVDRPKRFQDAVMLHERIYREQHAWNPPVTLTPERARSLFMDADELDPMLQLLAIRNDAVCGVASLRTTSDSNALDLGWVGTVVEPHDQSTRVARALIGTCVVFARQRDATITIEVDHANSVALAIIEELPVEWEADWLTFARAR